MDLPTCPSCGQSVLDDDVDDCPFCGASLSGSSSTKPKPRSDAVPKPSSTATATKDVAAPARSTATKAKPAEDDPFALERATATRKKVVPLKPRAESGRRHEVVCPMCETIGYTARKAAGMDVKCANPDCEFPVFTAPAIEPEEDPDAAEAAARDASLMRLLTPVNIGAGIGVVVLVVLGIVFLGGKKKPKPNPNGDIVVNPNGGGTPTPTTKKSNGAKTQVPVKSSREQLVELRDKIILKLRSETDGIQGPLPKAIGRQYSIIAFARAGRMKEAEEAMRQLKTVTQGAGGTFYQVRALVSLAAAYRKQGDQTQAAARLKESQTVLAGVRRDAGRPRYDAATYVIAGLIVAGKTGEAKQLLATHTGQDEAALESLILFAARTVERDNVAAAVANRPVSPPASPLAVAVTLLLTGWQQSDAALNWANAQSGRAKSDCLTAWTEARIALTEKPDVGELKAAIDPIAKSLSSFDLATFRARIARRYHAAKLQPAAEIERKAARELLEKTKTPAGDSATRHSRAAAWYELAHTDLLFDSANGASAALSKALQALGVSGGGGEFAVQTRYLESALDWNHPGALEAVWTVFQGAAQAGAGERWYGTLVPWKLLRLFGVAGNTKLASAVNKALESHKIAEPNAAKGQYWAKVQNFLQAGEHHDAGQFFRSKKGVTDPWRRLYAITISSRLLNADKFDAAYEFNRGLAIAPAAQMIAFEFFAARLVHTLGPHTAWKKLNKKPYYRPEESAAISYGFTRVLRIPPEPKPEVQETPEKQ